MGAGCWTGVSEQKFLAAEKAVLAHSGLNYETEIKVTNVVIDSTGNYIRTMEIGDRNKPVMVMMHGYGASSVIFWKILKPLRERFYLILIDIIGMGGSSRPEFKIKN